MIRQYDHPAVPVKPYPDADVQVSDFRYDSALVLLRLKDAPKLRTGEDADYLTGRPYLVSWRTVADDWRQISVPAGLITDLTSVPRPLRWVAGRVGPWLEAAIVHDYLYIAWQDVPDRGARDKDRAFADQIMWVAMQEAQVNPLLARLIFWSVRLFGAGGFRRRTKDRYADLNDPAITQQLAFQMPR